MVICENYGVVWMMCVEFVCGSVRMLNLYVMCGGSVVMVYDDVYFGDYMVIVV